MQLWDNRRRVAREARAQPFARIRRCRHVRSEAQRSPTRVQCDKEECVDHFRAAAVHDMRTLRDGRDVQWSHKTIP